MKATSSVVVEARLLNVKQAASYLGTTVWQIRSLTWDKKLAGIRLGQRLLFDVKELDKFVDGLVKEAA